MRVWGCSLGIFGEDAAPGAFFVRNPSRVLDLRAHCFAMKINTLMPPLSGLSTVAEICMVVLRRNQGSA